jgi:cell division protein WhiA
MTLSDDLRSELAAIAPKRGCCRLAEISALFHSAGTIHLRGRGEISVHLDLASSGIARRAFSLLRELGIHSEIRTYRRRAFDRATRYQLHVTGDDAAIGLLVEAGVLDSRHAPLERPPKRVVGRACCRGAYLRGALLGGGSLSGPRSPHLELRTTSLEGAEFLRSVAAAGDATIGVLDRGRHAVAYAKGFDAIEAVLSAAGAADTVLAFEERSIVAAARGEANRLANADHANLVRTSRAAQEQLEAVRALQAAGALERLPDRLYEIARLRLRHPTLPLRELAARCDPPTTKASVHRRLKKLQDLATP